MTEHEDIRKEPFEREDIRKEPFVDRGLAQTRRILDLQAENKRLQAQISMLELSDGERKAEIEWLQAEMLCERDRADTAEADNKRLREEREIIYATINRDTKALIEEALVEGERNDARDQ
jgi:Skp family chaperone for outer membrane proteins